MAPCVWSQINDRYEFPDELDLDVGDGKYLSENADRSVRNLYKLHSVLVHSGGVHGGHYYAFIEPDGKQWLKFDDERVIISDRAHMAILMHQPAHSIYTCPSMLARSCYAFCERALWLPWARFHWRTPRRR